MGSLIEDLAEKYQTAKSKMLDEHLFQFLALKGITESTNLEEIRKALKEVDMEIVTEIHETATSEIYKYKLVKIYATSTLEVPLPQLIFR